MERASERNIGAILAKRKITGVQIQKSQSYLLFGGLKFNLVSSLDVCGFQNTREGL